MEVFYHLLPNFDKLGHLGYLIVFIFSIAESIAFVGTIVPGATVVVLAGFAASRGVIDIGDLLWFASIGAIIGDSISYYFGYSRNHIFKESNRFLKIAHLNRGKAYFHKYGNMSVFFGRFVGPLRAMIPFIAGAVRMDFKKFLFWNILSGIIWAGSHILLGYFFGSILGQVDKTINRTGGIILLLSVFITLIWFAIKKSDFIIKYTNSLIGQVISTLSKSELIKDFKSNHYEIYYFFINRFNKRNFLGLPFTILSIIFVVGVTSFFGLAEDIKSLESIVNLDNSLMHYLYLHRTPELLNVFVMFTNLGKWSSVLVLTLIISSLLIFKRKFNYLFAYLSVILGNEVTMYALKLFINRARPASDIAYYIEKSPSFPSGHSAIAMAMYGFLIYLSTKLIKKWSVRLRVIFLGSLIILGIGFRRMYLGVHYLSDVLGGFTLGALWLVWGITFTELLKIRKERSSNSSVRL